MQVNEEKEHAKGSSESPPDAQGWRPIEGAPKDGTPVIISVAGFVGEAAYRSEGSHEGAWWWANEGPGDYHADSIDSRHGEPTHWMPLPSPPDAVAERETET